MATDPSAPTPPGLDDRLLATVERHAIVVVTDVHGCITYANDGFCALTQYSREELVGHNHDRLNSDFHPPEFKHDLLTTIAGGRVWQGEIRIKVKDGTFRWLSTVIAPVPGSDGRPTANVAIHTDITTRKEAERDLERERRLLRQMIDQMPDAAYVKDRDSRFIVANRATAAALGLRSGDEAIGKTDADFFPPEAAARFRADELRVLEGEPLLDREEFYTDANGVVCHRRAAKVPLRDADGKIEGLVGTSRDITAEVNALARARENERVARAAALELNFALRAAGMGVWQVDLVTREVYRSPESLEVLGVATLAPTIEAFLELVHPDDRAALGSKIHRAAQERGQIHGECRIVRPDATERWLEYMGKVECDEQGNAERLLGTIADITERKLADVSLRESREQFRQVVENIEEVFWIVDAVRDRLIYVSPSFDAIWGWPRADVFAHPEKWTASLHPEDRARVLGLVARQKEIPYDATYRIVRADGTVRWIRDRSYPVRGRDGIATRVVGVAADITRERELEANFLRAQRLEAIGALSSGIAHDLNNILAPMLMAGGMLRNEMTNPRSRELVTMIENSAQRGASIIRQLLTYSRGIEGERVPVQLRHLIKDLLAIARETFPRNIEIVEDCARDLPLVKGDPTQLHQVLLNLGVNARDAMPQGGRLTISGGCVEAANPEQPEARPRSCVRLSVQDTGAGVRPEIIERIFDPFFTTKGPGEGTGLGLSTALGIVKSHDGFLTVDSVVGQGATFHVFLPVAAPDAQKASPHDAATPAQGNGELVLVVDDERTIREITRLALEHSNYHVVMAADGAEGLEASRRLSGQLRVAVVDVMMPVMGGIALVQCLRSESPQVRVIATTGMDHEGDVAMLRALGVTEILRKPYVPDALRKAIASELARPG